MWGKVCEPIGEGCLHENAMVGKERQEGCRYTWELMHDP